MRFFRDRRLRDRDEATAKDTVVEQERLAYTATTLAEISRELADWVPILRQLAEAEALRDLTLGQSSEIAGSTIRSVIAARRLRDEYFWPSMSETAWTLMLELFARRLEGERLDVNGLSAATGAPLASCEHWIDWLIGRGIVFRNGGPQAERSALVDLTDSGGDKMHAYLIASLHLSPWVL